MKVLVPGHEYELLHLDGDNTQILRFVNRGNGNDCEGVTNQEVIRALIDRVIFLESQVHWDLNKDIINHLRSALVLHEARALIRKTEKGKLLPELLSIGNDGHFIIQQGQ